MITTARIGPTTNNAMSKYSTGAMIERLFGDYVSIIAMAGFLRHPNKPQHAEAGGECVKRHRQSGVLYRKGLCSEL